MLRAGDLLVVNDSRVFPARLRANKPTGGGVELLVLEAVADAEGSVAAMVRTSKALHKDARLVLGDGSEVCVVTEPKGGRCRIAFATSDRGELQGLFAKLGAVPLPPYIDRPQGPSSDDLERYQTVYADREGSVAAPTAGLHFSREAVTGLAAAGVEICKVTLHVGPGTFVPVRGGLEDHRMEKEWCEVSDAVVRACARTRAAGGRVVAVGTTTVRAIESACAGGSLEVFSGPTGLFIRPGFDFRAVDALITNFHLPGSTLLALVAAFAGAQLMRAVYETAVHQRYRFYSYGDAMLIL